MTPKTRQALPPSEAIKQVLPIRNLIVRDARAPLAAISDK